VRAEGILNVVVVEIVLVGSIFVICTVNVVNMIVVQEISDEQANGTKILKGIWNNCVFFFSVMVYDDVASVYEVMAIVYEGTSNDDEVTAIVIDGEERLSDDVVTLSETGNENAIWKKRSVTN
jgi:hypothetical protein